MFCVVVATFAGIVAHNLAAGDGSGRPCSDAIAKGEVCEAANQHAGDLMKARGLTALTVMQNVRTGSLLSFAPSDSATLDVTSPLLPLSTVKLMVAASWLSHEKSTSGESRDSHQVLIDSIVSGNDKAGRQLASALRKAIGTEQVLNDLKAYGFTSWQSSMPKTDSTFWSKLPSDWREKLIPAVSYHSLGPETTAADWEDTLSIGEARFTITALHLSRFLQAVGNHGIMIAATARNKESGEMQPVNQSRRVMEESASLKLQQAMRETVQRGTAKSVKPILAGTGWSVGGKTGTGPGPNAPGPESDGWFAGLIFDPNGDARFTVATFVKHGGLGGGNAASLSAELAKFIISDASNR